MMSRINNRKELNIERIRLVALKNEHELHFKLEAESIKRKFLPYKNLFSRADRLFSSGKESSSSFSTAIQLGIPLIIDRFFLGTRGLILKKIAIWASEFAATRLSQEIPSDLLKKLSGLIPLLSKMPIIKKLLRKL